MIVVQKFCFLKGDLTVMQKDVFKKDLFVLWLALAALIIAALSLNSSLESLIDKERGDI